MNRSALLALTAAGLMFGLTVPLSKVALGWLDPAWLAAVRFGLAAPVLALVARRTLRGAMTPRIAAWGAAGYGAMVVLQNFGVERTSVTHAAIIFGAVPVFVAAGSALTGRAVAGPAAWSGFGVALGGVALVAGSGGDASPTGDVLVLALGGARLGADRRPGRAARGPRPGRGDRRADGRRGPVRARLRAPDVAARRRADGVGGDRAGALISVGSLIPFSLYAYGQARVSAELAGAFVNLEPVVGVARACSRSATRSARGRRSAPCW